MVLKRVRDRVLQPQTPLTELEVLLWLRHTGTTYRMESLLGFCGPGRIGGITLTGVRAPLPSGLLALAPPNCQLFSLVAGCRAAKEEPLPRRRVGVPLKIGGTGVPHESPKPLWSLSAAGCLKFTALRSNVEAFHRAVRAPVCRRARCRVRRRGGRASRGM